MDAGIFGGELRVDVEVRSEIRHISAIRRTSTTGKYSDDLTSPVEDNRSRVSRLREPGVVIAVPQHSDFSGRLIDTIRRIVRPREAPLNVSPSKPPKSGQKNSNFCQILLQKKSNSDKDDHVWHVLSHS